MYKKTKADIWIESLIWLAVILFLITNCGCASWDYERKEYDAKGVLIHHVKVSGDQVIIDSSIDEVRVEVRTNGTRILSIGNVTRNTDEEAVGAVAEGVTDAVIGIVVPGL